MTTDTFGAVALATGMWIIASVALIGGDLKSTPRDGIVWTVASSEKVASHPTLIRRSLPGASGGVRTAALEMRH